MTASLERRLGAEARVPRVWVLMGHKAGDNSQVLALGEALDWPFEVKRFVYRKRELFSILQLVTLAGFVKRKSDKLVPPWPDLVISAGRRNEPIARWIQRQAAREGKQVRLVHVGRPWAHYDKFDLLVTTPQYRLPTRGNILHNMTPLHRVSNEKLEAGRREWAPRLKHLKRPYVAVLVGGNSGPYTLDRRTATRLGRDASAMAQSLGGSLLVTTSARTRATAAKALEDAIVAPAHIYSWSPDKEANPYFAYLALADAIIVTGDSMSMLAEACATGKPVHIFDMGIGRNAMRESGGGKPKEREHSRFWDRLDRDHLRAYIYRGAMRIGPKRLTRDIRIVHTKLVASGRAVWLGDEFRNDVVASPLEDVTRAVTRVRALFRLGPFLPEADTREVTAEERRPAIKNEGAASSLP